MEALQLGRLPVVPDQSEGQGQGQDATGELIQFPGAALDEDVEEVGEMGARDVDAWLAEFAGSYASRINELGVQRSEVINSGVRGGQNGVNNPGACEAERLLRAQLELRKFVSSGFAFDRAM